MLTPKNLSQWLKDYRQFRCYEQGDGSCFDGIPRLCDEQNYGGHVFHEQLAFSTNLI